jgi:pumilio RNA-binding family
MIKDQHANHVIQKLIERGYTNDIISLKEGFDNNKSKNKIIEVISRLKSLLEKIKQNVYDLCIHALGCRIIQMTISCLPFFYVIEYVYKEIENHLITLTEDKYGNYVIQHILK